MKALRTSLVFSLALVIISSCGKKQYEVQKAGAHLGAGAAISKPGDADTKSEADQTVSVPTGGSQTPSTSTGAGQNTNPGTTPTTGTNPSTTPGGAQAGSTPATTPAPKPTPIVEKVETLFKATCGGCHKPGGEASDESFANMSTVREDADDLADELAAGNMPKGNPGFKDTEDGKVLLNWLRKGAPADATYTTMPPPAPTKPVTWAEVQPIFQNRCSGCHASGLNPAPITTQSVVDANKAIIRTRVSGKTMPQAGSAQAQAMTQDERDLIVNYVSQ